MASLLLKRTDTIISVKCVYNMEHPGHPEQKRERKESGTKNWKLPYNV